MKNSVLFTAGLVMCIVLCGCVAKKQFDPTANSSNAEVTSEASADESASGIPDALVGFWEGTGEPTSGGSPIRLDVTINADATGEYTFEQDGYTETYPFTIENADRSFSVTIPEENELGITRCTGTYEYEEGTLTLHIKTEFASGRSFSYTAVCQKASDSAAGEASSAEQSVEHLFPWRGHTMNVKSIVDNSSIVSGANKPEGRLVQISLECVDGVMDWETLMSGYTDYSLKDASGNEYTAVSTGFTATEGAGKSIQELQTNDYVGMAPTFDIPEDADITAFTLYVKTETDGESIIIPLKDVAIQH